MFCTVNFVETKKRFSKNFRIEKNKIGEIEFLKVTIYKESALKKIDKKLKSKVDLAIVSENIKDYNFNNFETYNNDNYLIDIAKYTFKCIIKMSNINPNLLSICVVDKQCKHPDFVRSLVNKAKIVKVCTNSFDKYLSVSEGVLDDFGVDLILSSSIKNANLGIVLENEPKIWFNDYSNIFLLNKKCVRIGAGLKKFVPTGISECDFAGVLHKYNEFKRLKLLNANTLCMNGKYYELNEYNIKNFLDNNDKNW